MKNKMTNSLTASSFLVAAILAVLFPVAQLRLVDTERLASRAFRAEVLVARAHDRRAALLVRAVLAVLVAVALVAHRDAEGVRATELVGRARRET